MIDTPATMFTFSPLQGALSEATASQSLLELDGGVKVLIDVGWDETLDVEKLKELEKYVGYVLRARARVVSGAAWLTFYLAGRFRRSR